MGSRVRQVTIDARDVRRVATFWAAALDGDYVAREGSDTARVRGAHGELLFVQHSETRKTTRNRVHVDLQPTDRTQDDEVVRLQALGATVVSDLRGVPDEGFVVLADPEGNEFCLEPTADESAAAGEPPAPVWLPPHAPPAGAVTG